MLEKIEKFCTNLETDTFFDLSEQVQVLFLTEAEKILRKKEKYPSRARKVSKKIFRMFKGGPPVIRKKNQNVYLQNLYTKILEWNNNGESFVVPPPNVPPPKVPPPKVPVKTPRKKYDKTGQKYPEPDKNSPLFLYYSSLHKQRPDSKLAVNWLREHGIDV